MADGRTSKGWHTACGQKLDDLLREEADGEATSEALYKACDQHNACFRFQQDVSGPCLRHLHVDPH